jgi:intraflagellar transport protein 56
LASIHYLRLHYQEAIDIYKKILLENRYCPPDKCLEAKKCIFRNFIALNVYLALCYYKLDYYDVSLVTSFVFITVSLIQEVLQAYLSQHPDSATAVNLRACNQHRLYNGQTAEAELRTLQNQTTASFQFAKDLITHNTVWTELS